MNRALATIVLASALAAGCSHVHVARDLNGQSATTDGRTIAHINVSTWGIYLFNWLPIITGSVESPGSFTFFRDTATVQVAVELATRESAALGATHSEDLQSFADSWWQSASLLFWMRAAYCSANAVAVDPPPPGG